MKHIEFSCDQEDVFTYFKPVPAKKKIPNWYKTMSIYTDGFKSCPSAKERVENKATADDTFLTIKNCIPVQDYITSGYIIVAPYDILISPSVIPDNKLSTFFWWSKADNTMSHHGHVQCPIKIQNKDNVYLKFINPWEVKTPPGYSCIFYQPEFFFEERFKLFPAIVDTDLYNSPVHFPGVITTVKDFKIEAGTPLMLVFPFKRDEWESKIALRPKTKTPKNFIEKMYLKLFHSQKIYD